MIPLLTIFRGLPGSGKSKAGHKYAAKHGCLLIEPDMLLVSGRTYRYTPERYAQAVNKAKSMLCLAAYMAADVVYTDVLPTLSDVADIYNLYGNAGGVDIAGRIQVMVRDMPPITLKQSIKRNQHKVCEADLKAMIKAWQPWEEPTKVEVDECWYSMKGSE